MPIIEKINNNGLKISKEKKFEPKPLVNNKALRAEEVANITVTIQNGKIFDGDEEAQMRMLKAITASDILGLTETQWKLADNNISTVTLDELKEAFGLAVQEQSTIWFKY